MPFDSTGSGYQGKISELSRWIEALENTPTSEPVPHWANQFTPIVKAEILAYFKRERDSIQRQLDRHRAHDRERGIKY